MTEPRSGVRPAWMAAAAVALVAAGVAIGAALWRSSPDAAPPEAAAPELTADDHAAMGHAPPAVAPSGAAAEEQDVVVTLTPEMAARAGIRTVRASTGTAGTTFRLPGVITPNTYRQVVVTSLVPGRLTQIRAELGQRVGRGQVLATVYSTEFADAQTEYVRLHSELEAHEISRVRLRRLASIGAASTQELELAEAHHAGLEASVEAARSRLTLLGVSPQQIEALEKEHKVTTTVEIRSPAAGVVTARDANVGVNIEPSTALFTVVDLSTVWVVGDLYERHFATVAVGTPVTITTAAYPGLALEGRVSYIDPQVNAETRTARLRVEVPNPGGQLRLGMFVDIAARAGGGPAAVLVPRAALQAVGERQAVYVADPARPGQFVERTVELVGESSGDQVAVTGIDAGDQVVTDGAFFLRSERDRAAAPPAHAH